MPASERANRTDVVAVARLILAELQSVLPQDGVDKFTDDQAAFIEQALMDAAQEALNRSAARTAELSRAEAALGRHRCSGCGLRWEGPLAGVELCGECWRKGQPAIYSHSSVLTEGGA